MKSLLCKKGPIDTIERRIHVCTYMLMYYDVPKGGFKSENAGKNLCLQHKYSKSLSWAENLNKLFTVLGRKFNFSAQDSDLEYLCWRCKNSPISSDLKPPLRRLFSFVLNKTWWKIQTGRFFRIVDQIYQDKNFDGDFFLNLQEFWQVAALIETVLSKESLYNTWIKI